MDATYTRETNLRTVIWTALSCVMLGGLIGGTTNAVNGYVSPSYFRNMLGWDFPDIWTASVAQGIFEGLIYGTIFAILFCAAVGITTKAQANYRFVLRQLAKITGVVYICWILGGLFAVGLATLSPDYYRETVRQVPFDFQQMVAYAWVGGSILGGLFGGPLGLTFGILGVWTGWKKDEN